MLQNANLQAREQPNLLDNLVFCLGSLSLLIHMNTDTYLI